MMRTWVSPRMLPACLGLFLLFVVQGCTTLRVESDPPGARVLWSADGLDYRSWPPNSWELNSDGNGSQTPLRTRGSFGDTIFVTVDKDGYRRPLPKVVQLYTWRNERLFFDLEELPETQAARMRAEGYVRYRGEWVDPEARGLEEFEGRWMPRDAAFRLRQEARGLVEYRGEWYSQEEAQARIREDRIAEGYIEFKDRWVQPEVAERERAIDSEVAELRESKEYADMPAPRVLGRAPHEEAQVQLYNSTGQRVRFLFSGPLSRSFELEPYSGRGVRREDRILFPPGRYEIAIIPSALDATGQQLAEILQLDEQMAMYLSARALWSSWPLSSGMEYAINYSGRESLLEEGLDEFDLPDPGIDFEPPTIDIPEFQRPERQQRQRPNGMPPGMSPGGGTAPRR